MYYCLSNVLKEPVFGASLIAVEIMWVREGQFCCTFRGQIFRRCAKYYAGSWLTGMGDISSTHSLCIKHYGFETEILCLAALFDQTKPRQLILLPLFAGS